MKTILHERLRRAFSVLLLMASMLVVGVGEAKAWSVTFLEDLRDTLDYNCVLIMKAGSYCVPSADPDGSIGCDGKLSIQEMILEIPEGFRLDSLEINGVDYMNLQVPHTPKQYFNVVDYWPDYIMPNPNVPITFKVKAKIVQEPITSPEVLLSVLNHYTPDAARQEGNRIVLDKEVVFWDNKEPHPIKLASDDGLVIDGQGKYMTSLPLRVDSGTVVIKNMNVKDLTQDSTAYIVQNGGVLSIEDSYFSLRSVLVEQRGGLLRIDDTQISPANKSAQEADITLLRLSGADAKTEIVDARITDEVLVDTGSLEVQGGFVDLVWMNGGALELSGGYSTVRVAADCDITLSGARTSSILYNNDVTNIPSSASLLADGYVFAEGSMNMIRPFGKDIELMDTNYFGEMLRQYRFEEVVPEGYVGEETAAYQAAKTADVGPNGTDVKVIISGYMMDYEIYTPKGLAWLAVATNISDYFDRVEWLTNGKEYTPSYQSHIKLMNDLDMAGYGKGWPAINVSTHTLDGQGHRVYNMDISDVYDQYCAFARSVTSGVVKNLIVEGDIRLNKQTLYGNIFAAGLVYSNSTNGLIVNCAFKGTITNELIYSSASIAGLVVDNSGRVENCYVNPCGGLLGGVRPVSSQFDLDGIYPYMQESYNIAGLVYVGTGFRSSVKNCYFAGEINFDIQDNSNPNLDVAVYGFVDHDTIMNCYNGRDVLVEVMNDNIQDHQEGDHPWVFWAVDPEKQCGMPYLTIESPGETPTLDEVVITGKESFVVSHQGARVTLKSGAIYTIGQENASVAKLTVEDGAQLFLRQPLTVADSVIIKSYVETDKWTTFCTPIDMFIQNNLTYDPEDVAIWSKVGYESETEQGWKDYGAMSTVNNRAHLFVARDSSQMAYLVNEHQGPIVLDAVASASASGNKPDGNWFHFVANPYWQNLKIDGRAYVLNEDGTSFDLQENPVIPPFHCYMVANESIMDRVSTLRLSEGLPTSVEAVTAENGFRVWSERGALCWHSDKAADVEIYTMNGTFVARYDSSVGTRRVSLSRGVYLVIADGKATKVVL